MRNYFASFISNFTLVKKLKVNDLQIHQEPSFPNKHMNAKIKFQTNVSKSSSNNHLVEKGT